MWQEIESSSNGLLHLMVKLESADDPAPPPRRGMNREPNFSAPLHSASLCGPTYMMSALRGREGGRPKHDDSTERLRGMRTRKGRGVKMPQNLADIICPWPFSSFPPFLALEQSHPLIRRERAGELPSSAGDGGGHRWSTGEPSIGRPLLRPPAPQPRQADGRKNGGEPTGDPKAGERAASI